VTLGPFLRPWSGQAFRHIPADSSYAVLNLRFAGSGALNRWNRQGEPTLYLASDRGVALAEFARHFPEDRSLGLPSPAVERAVYRLEVVVGAVIDVRDPAVQRALSLKKAPSCFLDRAVARSTAQFPRRTTAAEALIVPSMAFLDAPERWALVLFLEKLPADPRRFVHAVDAAGTFQVGI